MGIRSVSRVLACGVVAAAVCMSAVPAGGDEELGISRDDLKALLGKPEVVVIDLRLEFAFNLSEHKIPGAVWESDQDLSWVGQYPKDKTLVLYCACETEHVSIPLAQKLRAEGYPKAYSLKGGWTGWERAGYPMEEK